jgi:hypothetical protein
MYNLKILDSEMWQWEGSWRKCCVTNWGHLAPESPVLNRGRGSICSQAQAQVLRQVLKKAFVWHEDLSSWGNASDPENFRVSEKESKQPWLGLHFQNYSKLQQPLVFYTFKSQGVLVKSSCVLCTGGRTKVPQIPGSRDFSVVVLCLLAVNTAVCGLMDWHSEETVDLSASFSGLV